MGTGGRPAGQCPAQTTHGQRNRDIREPLLTQRDAKIISFVVRDMHVLDFGALLGAHNVCVRVGNMCASWVHSAMGVPGSVRISVGPWNTMDDAISVVDIIRGIVK